MSTWFDRLRGETQGRISPSVITPTTGTKVFILGAEKQDDLATLQANDYTEVYQNIDLTGIDIAGATLDTLGVIMQQFKYSVGMTIDANTLALWNMDENYIGASNLIQPGINLYGQGDLEIAVESYSSVPSRCRKIPVGSTTAFLQGPNSPILIPGPMTEYTVLWWMNFDCDSYVSSSGIDPVILNAMGPIGVVPIAGFEIGLYGTTGVGLPHDWTIYVIHGDGAFQQTVLFTGYTISNNLGWKMFAIVYDDSLTGSAKLKLYIDGSFVTNMTPTTMLTIAATSLSDVVQVANPQLRGEIDQMKVSSVALNATQVSDEYDACVDPQVINDAVWKMSVRVDDIVFCERTIAAGEERRWRDFYAPVRQLSGSHKVAFRLQIEEV